MNERDPNTPWLEITTAVGCPNSCGCCPQDVLLRAYAGPGLLALDNFIRALNNVPPDLRIDFSGMCEPWANPHCTDMVECAHAAGHPVAVYTTLSGMTLEDAERLARMRFVEFVVHLPDANGLCRIAVGGDYDAVLRRLNTCIPNLRCGSLGGGVYKRIAGPVESIYVWEVDSRAGHVYPSRVLSGSVDCNRPGYSQNVLLPNGDVVLCCMDYGLEAVIGNLFSQRWEDLDRRAYSICARCDRAVEITESATADLRPESKRIEDPRTPTDWEDRDAFFRPHYMELMRRAFKSSCHTFLDAGCQHGLHAGMLATKGKEVVGADRSLALHPSSLASRGCKWFEGDWRDAGSEFDAIWCHHVLEHSTDPVNALHDMATCVRPGGRLFLAVPKQCPGFLWGHVANGWTGPQAMYIAALAGWRPVWVHVNDLNVLLDAERCENVEKGGPDDKESIADRLPAWFDNGACLDYWDCEEEPATAEPAAVLAERTVQ
ncbi:MAG: methyltransferase domain-containing protein [Planctomycetota bacterium]